MFRRWHRQWHAKGRECSIGLSNWAGRDAGEMPPPFSTCMLWLCFLDFDRMLPSTGRIQRQSLAEVILSCTEPCAHTDMSLQRLCGQSAALKVCDDIQAKETFASHLHWPTGSSARSSKRAKKTQLVSSEVCGLTCHQCSCAVQSASRCEKGILDLPNGRSSPNKCMFLFALDPFQICALSFPRTRRVLEASSAVRSMEQKRQLSPYRRGTSMRA
eukprot:36263-Amphidinium_carterae.1